MMSRHDGENRECGPATPTPGDGFRTGLALLVGAFALYIILPAGIFNDSRYQFVLSETLLRGGGFDLRPALGEPPFAFGELPDMLSEDRGLPFQLIVHEDRLLNWYPAGPAVLSAPGVALLNGLGLRASGPGWYDPVTEYAQQRILGAVLAALFVAQSYWLARWYLDERRAVAIALAAGFATSTLSVLSRFVWGDTWAVVLLAAGLLHIARRGGQGRPPSALLLGTLLSWMYFCRPTHAVAILAVTGLVLFRDWRAGARLCGVGAAWLVLFVAWSFAWYGSWRPHYYQLTSWMTPDGYFAALGGLLVSPMRGLLTFTPVLLVPLWWALRHGRGCVPRGLFVAGCVAVVSSLLLSGLWPVWWGGNCFGPRLLAGLLPWFVLLSSMCWAARLTGGPGGVGRRVAATALLLLSVAIHVVGAVSPKTEKPTYDPVDVGESPVLLWDWRRFVPAWVLDEEWYLAVPAVGHPSLAPCGRIQFSWPEHDAMLGRSWGALTPDGRWNHAEDNAVYFRLRADAAPFDRVRIVVRPHYRGAPLGDERLVLSLNGVPVGQAAPVGHEWTALEFAVPRHAWRRSNELGFHFPGAASRRGPASDPISMEVLVVEFSRAPGA